MKILFISALLPYPLYSGGQVRIYNLLKKLGEKHEITLLTFLRNKNERVHFAEFPFCKKVIAVYRGHAWRLHYIFKSILSSFPLLFTTYAHKTMTTLIQKELSKNHYDLIHIEPLYVWSSLPKMSLPLVAVEHNIEYEGYKGYVDHFPVPFLRPFFSFDVGKLRAWEQIIWKKATRVITVSSEDKKVISSTISAEKIAIVSNGVDIDEYPFIVKKPIKKPMTLLFVGNFAWLQNSNAVYYLLTDIWPLIRQKFPETTLRIVGRRASFDLSAAISNAGGLLLDGVEDIQVEYAKADFLLAPIRIGSGSRYKILEAMASGLPVITTPRGALGLDVEHNKELFIARDAEDFLSVLETVISDEALRESVRKMARKKIETQYSWETIAKDLDFVWTQVVKN